MSTMPDSAGEFCRKMAAYLQAGINNPIGSGLCTPSFKPVLLKVFSEPPEPALIQAGPFPLAVICVENVVADDSATQQANLVVSRQYRLKGRVDYYLADPSQQFRVMGIRSGLAYLYSYLVQQRTYAGYGDPNITVKDSDCTRFAASAQEFNQRDIVTDGIIDWNALMVYEYKLLN